MVDKTGAEIFVDALEQEGVDVMFGYPGGCILDLCDTLNLSKKIKFILVRHEQGAAHAADGYARSTGKVGVCLATCLLYTSPSPRDRTRSRMPSSA